MSSQGFWKSSKIYPKIFLSIVWPLTVATIIIYCKLMSKQVKRVKKETETEKI